MPQRIQELLSALCADGGRLRHQHTRNMVRRLLQYVGLDALVLAVVYLVRFLQLTKLAPSDRIDTLYLAAVILADKFSNDDNFCDLASTICLLCGARAEVLVTQENRILGVLLRASSLMVAPAVFRQVLRLVFEVRWGRLKQRGALAILERLSSDADDGLHPLPFDSPHDGAPEDSSWADFLLPGLGSGSMLGALPALLASGMSTATELAAPSRPRSTHRSTPRPKRRRAAPRRRRPAVAESRRRRRRRRAARAARAAARRRRRRQRLPRRRRLGRRRRHRRARRRDARARRGAAAAAEAAAAEAAAAERVDATLAAAARARGVFGAVDMADAHAGGGAGERAPRRDAIGARPAAAVLAPRRRAAHGLARAVAPRVVHARDDSPLAPQRCGRSSPVQPEAASVPTEEPLAAPAPRGGALPPPPPPRHRRRSGAGGRPAADAAAAARGAAAVAAAAAAALSSDADAAQPQA